MGDVVPNCHFVYYVGCSFAVPSGHCSAIPTLGASCDAAKRSLGGVIATFFASLLSAETSQTLCCHPSLEAGFQPVEGEGPQQTPNSAFHPNQVLSGDRLVEAEDRHEAKVKEKARLKELKEQGTEHAVKRRKKIIEEHYEDCGDDLTSLEPEAGVAW